jgi:uncharacterized protein
VVDDPLMSKRVLGLGLGLLIMLGVFGGAFSTLERHRQRKADARLRTLFRTMTAGPPLVPGGPAVRLALHGADRRMRSDWGADVLMLAAFRGEADTVHHLLREGFDANGTDAFGQTPLHYACRSGNAEVVQLLLAHGAKVDTENRRGETALAEAARYEQAAITALLLAKGADPNHRDRRGATPLMNAVEGARRATRGPSALQVALLLVKQGADVNLRDRKDESALRLATDAGAVPMIRLLKQAGAKP